MTHSTLKHHINTPTLSSQPTPFVLSLSTDLLSLAAPAAQHCPSVCCCCRYASCGEGSASLAATSQLSLRQSPDRLVCVAAAAKRGSPVRCISPLWPLFQHPFQQLHAAARSSCLLLRLRCCPFSRSVCVVFRRPSRRQLPPRGQVSVPRRQLSVRLVAVVVVRLFIHRSRQPVHQCRPRPRPVRHS